MDIAKEPIGLLFGEIPYYEKEELNLLVDNIEYQQAFYFIHKALSYSYANGIYNLTEAEIISKSLRIFTKTNISNEI